MAHINFTSLAANIDRPSGLVLPLENYIGGVSRGVWVQRKVCFELVEKKWSLYSVTKAYRDLACEGLISYFTLTAACYVAIVRMLSLVHFVFAKNT